MPGRWVLLTYSASVRCLIPPAFAISGVCLLCSVVTRLAPRCGVTIALLWSPYYASYLSLLFHQHSCPVPVSVRPLSRRLRVGASDCSHPRALRGVSTPPVGLRHVRLLPVVDTLCSHTRCGVAIRLHARACSAAGCQPRPGAPLELVCALTRLVDTSLLRIRLWLVVCQIPGLVRLFEHTRICGPPKGLSATGWYWNCWWWSSPQRSRNLLRSEAGKAVSPDAFSSSRP